MNTTLKKMLGFTNKSILALTLGLSLYTPSSQAANLKPTLMTVTEQHVAALGPDFRSEYTTVNTSNPVTLHYVIGGKGPALLLIAGWPQTWYQWRKVMPELAKEFTVIAVDYRGQGDSDRPPTSYDTNNVGRDLHELMQQLKFDSYKVVAHDVGMWIGYSMASQYPKAVERMAMMEALLPGLDPLNVWIFPFNQLPDLNEILIEGKEKTYITWIINSFSYRPGSVAVDEYVRAYSQPGGIKAGFDLYRAIPESGKQNKEHAKNKLKMPIVSIAGANSIGTHQKRMLEPLVANMQGAYEIPKCGHYTPEECPDEMMQILLPFLRGK